MIRPLTARSTVQSMLSVLLLLAAVLLPESCKDAGDVLTPSAGQVIQVALRNTDTYRYTTAARGDEEGAVISRQAQHFRISEIRRNASTNFTGIYVYQPEAGYTGEDAVTLKITTNAVGTPEYDRVTTVGLHFTVTQ